MTSGPLTEYEQLAPHEAARVDAVCDGFEQAWKAARADGDVPRIATYLDGWAEPARTILARELIALDRACRERYGITIRPEEYQEFGVAAGSPVASDTAPGVSDAITSVRRVENWPSLPGLVLMEVIGSGGMGVVFKARQAALDRYVAVKLLRDANLGEAGQRERFLQEARVIARLQHPHLVQVYDFGELPSAGAVTSQPYLVLEYVSGGSLANVWRGSPQPPREAARLVATLADAIHYAHQRGVVHRELKPANILIAMASGECPVASGDNNSPGLPLATSRSLLATIPKITDFGLAKFQTGSDLTRTGEVLGTPSYMAPEQTTGKPGGITAVADVYGLGAILYEALTGRAPFRAETAVATVVQVQEDEPVPPRRLQPTVPRDLETICLKCLRKEASQRYATAQELAEDLRRFLAGEPIRARRIGALERVRKWARRRPAAAALIAISALASILLIAVLLVSDLQIR